MKAFWTYFKGCRYEWGDYIHANTVREARPNLLCPLLGRRRVHRYPSIQGAGVGWQEAWTAKNIKPINDLWRWTIGDRCFVAVICAKRLNERLIRERE